ncbi:MAG: xylulokinase [Paracoccaceae bacterium]|nr:xylulokinase [Paracoccaceae bacterium]MBT4954835.1 xylulokinase [Paracoccaceae bacterium]MBT5316812.1 xylulokinase [Paracoccaceae bacterium]MBT5475104.1 xylulokinase [Paracoccaceae bacterium]MBT5852486.1 xylulokinase [Paracoccaceae bacterium]
MAHLGIDLGTSGLRVLLADEHGLPIGATERAYSVSQPAPGWSEQDPADWIVALENAIAELRLRYREFLNIKSIGVAGHMHGAVLLDKSGSVLRPCILWNDTRSNHQAAKLDADKRIQDLSGNIVFPGFTAPKLVWVRENEPEVFAQVAKVVLPAGFLNFYLTGEYVADMSDSAGTSWLDVGRRSWSDHLLEASNMRLDQMPRLVEGCEMAGRLRRKLARKWGLSEKVAVAGGAGDNAAAACGIGAMEEGQGFVSLGTSGVLLAARRDYRPAPQTAVHTFCHAVSGRWYQMGVMLSATNSLNWLAAMSQTSPASLTDALHGPVARPGRVRFLPYLSGERTPHNDSEIRGSFTGIGTETSREDLTRAVLEGVSFGLKDSFEALADTEAHLAKLIAIGGGTASKYWLELIATVLGVPLEVPSQGEFGAALGAVRLGMVACGEYGSEEAMGAPQISEVIEPDYSLSENFYEEYVKFQRAYRGIKSVQ